MVEHNTSKSTVKGNNCCNNYCRFKTNIKTSNKLIILSTWRKWRATLLIIFNLMSICLLYLFQKCSLKYWTFKPDRRLQRTTISKPSISWWITKPEKKACYEKDANQLFKMVMTKNVIGIQVKTTKLLALAQRV